MDMHKLLSRVRTNRDVWDNNECHMITSHGLLIADLTPEVF